MPNVILRNILLQLGEVEVKGKKNIEIMYNAMTNLEKLILAVEKVMEQEKEMEKKEGAAHEDHNESRENI